MTLKLKPIRSDLDLERALERIDELWERNPARPRVTNWTF